MKTYAQIAEAAGKAGDIRTFQHAAYLRAGQGPTTLGPGDAWNPTAACVPCPCEACQRGRELRKR